MKRLGDPNYAAEYLEETLASGDGAAFLIALNDVVDARGGVGTLAKQARITRPSLYKVLSKKRNPTLEMLQQISNSLGLRIAIALPALRETYFIRRKLRLRQN